MIQKACIRGRSGWKRHTPLEAAFITLPSGPMDAKRLRGGTGREGVRHGWWEPLGLIGLDFLAAYAVLGSLLVPLTLEGSRSWKWLASWEISCQSLQRQDEGQELEHSASRLMVVMGAAEPLPGTLMDCTCGKNAPDVKVSPLLLPSISSRPFLEYSVTSFTTVKGTCGDLHGHRCPGLEPDRG
jgi:hypothetical protein